MYIDRLREAVTQVLSRPSDDAYLRATFMYGVGDLRSSAWMVVSGDALREFHRRLSALEVVLEQDRVARELEAARQRAERDARRNT